MYSTKGKYLLWYLLCHFYELSLYKNKTIYLKYGVSIWGKKIDKQNWFNKNWYLHGSSKQQIIGLPLQFPFVASTFPLVVKSIFLHPIYESIFFFKQLYFPFRIGKKNPHNFLSSQSQYKFQEHARTLRGRKFRFFFRYPVLEKSNKLTSRFFSLRLIPS